MKIFTLAIVAIFSALPIAIAGQTVQPPSIQIGPANRTLSVSASDHAEAEADVADLNVGFVTYGPTLQAVYKSASETSNAIVKAMLDAGASRTEIQSRSQRVSRLNEYEIKAQKGMKFSVSQSWLVSVEPKTAALILDAAVQAGANQSGDINWRLKNGAALDGEAIRRATERARAMAAELAKAMGVTLGKPLYATNSMSGNIVRPMFEMRAASVNGQPNAPAPLAIEAQRVTATASVEIIYAIE
ncbi:MAG: SIMPL domain-containing protein [Acidobacteriaceae bacterium]